MADDFRVSFVRDFLVATLVIVGLYGVARGVQFPPVQIPGYLLLVGFSLLERPFGSSGVSFDVLFAGYLAGLGLISAGVAHGIRNWGRAPTVADWRVGVASALVVVGAISLAFALIVLSGVTQLVQLAPALVAGLVSLLLAGSFAGLSVPIRRG